MKSFLKKVSIGSVALFTPVAVFAAGGASVNGLVSLLDQIHLLISRAIPVLIALAVLAFMLGIVKYLFGKKENGKEMMFWGIIALFVMTSVWGLVGILRGTLFSGNDAINEVQIPNIR